VDVIWEPTQEEVEDMVKSQVAQDAWLSNKTFFWNIIRGGQKTRLAFLQQGTGAVVETVQVLAAGSLVDLRSLL
jgi:hypothetical protein